MSVTRAELRRAVAARMMRTVVGLAGGGSTVALADPTELQDAGASDDLWTGAWLHITAGANAGEVRRVTAFDPASGSVTVNRPFARPIDATSEYDLEQSLEQAPHSDTFLLQKKVNMKPLGGRMGWFRCYHICREVIPCWWDPVTHEYQMVSPAQIKRFRLQPLRRIMRQIAQVSRMKKFSSEICLHEDGKFYAVDYVNADPDMNPRSFYANGVPDEIVRHIVWLLFYEAMQVAKRGHGFFDDELEASESSADWLEQRRAEQRGAVSR